MVAMNSYTTILTQKTAPLSQRRRAGRLGARTVMAQSRATKACNKNQLVSTLAETMLTSLPLTSAMTLMTTYRPAFAEEEVVDAAANKASILGFTPEGFALAFSPLLIYSVFFVYRATINPKAKLNDLLFVAAACVVLGNIASIVIFKKRIY